MIWLEASYNPVFDTRGKLYKIVKFASDITAEVLEQQAESEAAQVAYQTARQTDAEAQGGAEVVNRTVALVQGIAGELNHAAERIGAVSQQSDLINSIVQSIRGIADQTNLLALNAAIEARAPASRAGVLPWWRTRFATSPPVPHGPPRRSSRWSSATMNWPRKPSAACAKAARR